MYKEEDKNGNRQCVICGTQQNIGTHHGSMPGMMWNMCHRHSLMDSLRESRNEWYRERNTIELKRMEKDEDKYLFMIAYERSIVQRTGSPNPAQIKGG